MFVFVKFCFRSPETSSGDLEVSFYSSLLYLHPLSILISSSSSICLLFFIFFLVLSSLSNLPLLFSLTISSSASYLLPHMIPPPFPSLKAFSLTALYLLTPPPLCQRPPQFHPPSLPASLFICERGGERWYHAGITAIQFWYPTSAVEPERAAVKDKQWERDTETWSLLRGR